MNKLKIVTTTILLLLSLYSCDEYDLVRTNPRDTESEDYNPTVPGITTGAVSLIKSNSASIEGNVTSDGYSTVTSRGLCWGTSIHPTTTNSKIANGVGTGTFSGELTGLNAFTKYYVRAYAINIEGTSYGNEINFTTLAGVPTITTTELSAISISSATGGGNISSDGGATITASGVCWSTTANPEITLNNKTTNGSGVVTGPFTSSISSLLGGTVYYIRAYATNIHGTTYGNELSFTTIGPKVETSGATAITGTTAVSGGNVTPVVGPLLIAKGICWSTSPNPTIDLPTLTNNGPGRGGFSSDITGLTPITTYYVRAYATHSIGTTYGPEISFTTTVSIGNSYMGGIVGYIFQSGDAGFVAGEIHGLIAAPADQSTSAYWGISSTYSLNTGTVVGTGNSNTNIIVGVNGPGTYAAGICSDLSLNSYSDWFLPSKDELNKLYLSRTAIGGFGIANYWSSTESLTSSGTTYIIGKGTFSQAWCQTFDTGGVQSSDTKSNLYSVRAVRSF